MIYKFRDRMIQLNKFEDLNSRFASLETTMTQRYKFVTGDGLNKETV